MTDREIVARVREAIRDWDFRSDWRGMIVTDLRALCDAVERLERERDEAIQSRKEWMTECDREILAHRDTRAEVTRLTAENERLERLVVRNVDPLDTSPSDGADVILLHKKHHPENYAALTILEKSVSNENISP